MTKLYRARQNLLLWLDMSRCDLKVLCRNRNSPYPGQLYRDIISPCLGQLYCDTKVLGHDRKSTQPGQLCRNIELLCHNTKPLPLAILCHDIKILCHDIKPLHYCQLCCNIKPLCHDKESPFSGRLGRDIKHFVIRPLLPPWPNSVAT